MEEAVTFWLDNKISSGFKVAEIGSQTLVSYRDKFYVIEEGAAKMKGVRPLHYSKSSMPPVWKKAMKGILPPLQADKEVQEEVNLPVTTSYGKERPKMNNSAVSRVDAPDSQVQSDRQPAVRQPAQSKSNSDPRPIKISQATIVANCPYCNHKHDLPFEKGKNGKPFFVPCARCSTEFAVRFVPVTVYQAQVAGFR